MTTAHVGVIGAGPAGAACVLALLEKSVSVIWLARRRKPGVAVGDAGVKAISCLRSLPEVENRPGVTVASMDPDHTIFHVDANGNLRIGDQLALLPAQQDATVSRWDRFIGVRQGKVEAVWDIQARGCHN